MNQMLQDPTEVKASPEVIDRPPPAAQHPRFAKPQRVAFVQSSWHRDMVEECRIAFLKEIEARGIAPAQIDLFEVPGALRDPAACADSRKNPALHRDRRRRPRGRRRHLPS